MNFKFPKPSLYFLIAGGLFLLASSAAAKESKSEEVEAVADQLEYERAGKKIIAKNNVVITYGDVKMTSDYAEVETDTKQAFARGHVVIIRGERVAAKGEEVHYNFETDQGSFPDGRVTEFPWFAKGREVNQIKKGKMEVKGAEITTCDLEKPHYSIKAKRVTVYSGDKMIARDVTIYALGKPIFWWPYAVIPLQKPLESPFQIQPGYSSQHGAYILTSKGYSVTEWLWGKWHADYRFKRGFGGGGDVDYNFQRFKSYGNVRMYLTQDRNAPIPGNKANPYETREDRERGRISWRHRTDLNQDTYALVRFHNLADEFFLQDFFEREFRADVEPTSFVNVTANSDRHGFYVFNQAQIRSFENVAEKLPEIRFDWKNAPFFSDRIYYGSNTSLANLNQEFSREDLDFHVFRADSHHEWYFPMKWNEIKLTPSAFFRETLYDRERFNSDGHARTAFGSSVDLRTQLYRLFETSFDVMGVEANQLRHVFEPSVRYDGTWYSSVSNEELTRFDTVDAVDDANRVTFGLENRIQTKRVVGGKMQRVDFVSLNAFLSYDFHPDEEFGQSNFSVWTVEGQVRPYSWLQYEVRYEYDMIRDKFREFNQDFLAKKGRFRVLLGHRLVGNRPFIQAEPNNQFVFDVSAWINTRWAVGGHIRWDAEDNELEEWQISATRDLHDFLLDFGYNVRNSDIDESNKEFFFLFRLKAFPEYPLKSGARASFAEPRIGSTVAGSSTIQTDTYTPAQG